MNYIDELQKEIMELETRRLNLIKMNQINASNKVQTIINDLQWSINVRVADLQSRKSRDEIG